MKSRMIAMVGGIATCGLMVPAAFAGTTDVVLDVQRAAKTEGASPAESGMAVTRDGAQLATNTPFVQLAMPAGAVSKTDNATIVAGRGSTDFVLQQTDDALRASVHIGSRTDPERYRFNVTGVAQLEGQPDGSVNGLDSDGKVIAVIDAPWARDAAGTVVPTRYEIEGTTLIQVVDHQNSSFEYGITADPTVKVRWRGLVVQLNKPESTKFAEYAIYGTGAIGTWLAPGWTKALAAIGAAALRDVAKEAVKNGTCVSIWPTGRFPGLHTQLTLRKCDK